MIGERMARHGFVDRPCGSAVAAAAHTLALQAQDLPQARLGVRPRSTGVTEQDVADALHARTVARTWLMRATIHLVAADELRWLVHLFGPMIRRRAAKRWTDLGLPPEVLARVEALAPGLLADGPLTRHELAAGLGRHGLDVAHGQQPTHVLVYLATLGMTCHTDGDRFALLDEWLPDAPSGPRGEDALAELARRYFRAFSPATAADFTAWSGLPSGRALGLIRDELTPVTVHGRPGYRLGDEVGGAGVRLLSGFDNYLIGYRDRTGVVDDECRDEVYVGGIIRPTVLHDGRVIGRWRLDRRGGQVEVTMFGTAPAGVRDAVEAEVADLGRFVGRRLELSAYR